MIEFLKSFYSWFAFVPRISAKNYLEIFIIAVLMYNMLAWIKESRAFTLLKGLSFIVGFTVVAALLRLDTILWLLEKISYIAVTALLIIFQPELRKALEQLGKRNVLFSMFPSGSDTEKNDDSFSVKTINELARACFEMGKAKTGALMVIEQEEKLSDIERTGIAVDGLVTSQLLINIFEHNTPLHDGAVVIRGNRVAAATCYLPLSDSMKISKALGTRHRAAVGVSEVTDSVTLIVSEETGHVSVARNGSLQKVSDPAELKKILATLVKEEEKNSSGRFLLWKGKRKDEGKNNQEPES